VLVGRLPASCGAAAAGSLGWYATSTGNQISSRLLSARSANALLELPRAEGVIEAGALVGRLVVGWLAGWLADWLVGVLSISRPTVTCAAAGCTS
jgi:hypothetical protein